MNEAQRRKLALAQKKEEDNEATIIRSPAKYFNDLKKEIRKLAEITAEKPDTEGYVNRIVKKIEGLGFLEQNLKKLEILTQKLVDKQPPDNVKVNNLDQLVKEIKNSKTVLPDWLGKDISIEITKELKEISTKLENNKVVIEKAQNPSDFIPIRRVRKVGNGFVYDDGSWTGGGGGGSTGEVKLVDSSNNQITTTDRALDINLASSDVALGGGTQYTEGDTDASITGTAMLWEDASNTLRAVSSTKPLPVDIQDASVVIESVNLDIRDLSSASDSVSAVVTSSALPTGAATSAKQDTIIGHVDGIEALLTTIDADTSNLSVVGGGTEAAAQRVTIANDSTGVLSVDDNGGSLTVDYATTGSGTATGALRVEIANNGTGLVGLNAGTNAIGKLAANSGVDIGDVDVTSSVSGTLDHGSNLDLDTAAEQITATSFACKFGVTLRADTTNPGICYIGNSDVTAGSTAATDGIPLGPGDSLFLPVTNPNLLYSAASANNNKVYWIAV